ncbi:myosin heavy chain, non-muscle isoform X3 [Contarinia nasturtii]|uniref:myosin heavy chain, non-muscle isoform X3 n=1 Tax=Contarinia nasturtii TaxID=265458 RepID=UPI0012D3BC48|nr:myosin heavy chain, non-muscle isoform X3 [Contarinia nasturtii]
MHHLYPVSKGDQLCPLGFHPQVRWPTRCKRCFRDYKDHGVKRGDDIAASSPSLTDTSRTRVQLEKPTDRSWTSTSNLSSLTPEKEPPPRRRRPISWTSTDLDENEKPEPVAETTQSTEVNVALPRRRHTSAIIPEVPQVEESFTLRKPPRPPIIKQDSEDLTISRSDSLAERVRKMQLLKKQNSIERELRSRQSSIEKEQSPSPRNRTESTDSKRSSGREMSKSKPVTNHVEDVEKLSDELSSARRQKDDKNEISLRRLAFTDKGANQLQTNDSAKLQFKVNDLSRQLEDLKYEKLHLTTKIKDLEKSVAIKASKSAEEELRKKLLAAEQLCEELMDENKEIKKELKGMEDEIDEMQDNFREDQSNEFSTLKKEMEMTQKNCRILSFKLKKSERKIEQLEADKQSSAPAALISQIKQLEEELKISNDRLQQMQIEAEKAQQTPSNGKPTLSSIGKSNSMDGKISRSSLIRGSSQEDPQQLMRDLQDSIEREADIREQLKFAEEEAESLRKKVLRFEDENESLMVQLKKMATKARSRKLSPSAPSRLTVDASDKDEGISDEEDPAELRVLLDLNEQESSQLRRKVDELEQENKTFKTQLKEMRETPKAPTSTSKTTIAKDKEIAELQKKIVDMEKEMKLLRKSSSKAGTQTYQKLEEEKKKAIQDAKTLGEQMDTYKSEIKNLKSVIAKQETRCMELEKASTDNESKKKKALTDVKTIEEKLNKQESLIKQLEAAKSLGETNVTHEKGRAAKLEKELDELKNENRRWETKIADLDADLNTLRRKTQTEKVALEKEIVALKSQKDILPGKKMDELRKQNTDLQAQIDSEVKKTTDITSKYEQLQEQHVFIKAQLSSDKEALETSNNALKAKISTLETNVERFKRDNIDLSRKIVDVQNKCKDLESKSSQNVVVEHERKRLLSSLQEKSHQYELLVSENEMNKDLSVQLKKENDELRKKLGDFNKVNKVQTSLNDHNSSLEQEIKQLKAKLESTAMVSKSNEAATKLRYEQQVYNMQTELNSQQKQCERFKRDRDSFKQLLEAAKKTIKDLKSNSGRTSKASSGDEDDKSKILTLEQKIGNLEDELCETRLETSKLKNELVSEKTGAEIKLSELQSRINEYEEERLLGSGRTKMPGMKTKLELSWQKEREEHQRLLQETSTLARDLRQTLLEVERERDKERLENRRKIEQLERNNEEDLDEGRKKIAELQCDLLELRDAHAKLRTSNEKLRLERTCYERERDSFYRRGIELNLDRRLNSLLQLVDDLFKMSPDSVQSSILKKPPTPNMQRRLVKSTSVDRPDNQFSGSMEQVTSLISRLMAASDDIRQFQKSFGDDRERERMRRSSMRRATSIENGVSDNERSIGGRLSKSSSSTQNGSLYRKSLSVDQSTLSGQNPKIWRNANDSNSSIQSIDSELQYGGGGNYGRDSSLDSRLSGGSTQSDLPRGTRKKKRGLMGKLKSLTKSSKNNDTDGSQQVNSDSDISLVNYDYKSSKTNLKGRLSDMFRRSASASRNDSEDGGGGGSTVTVDSSNKTGAYSRSTTPNLSSRQKSPATIRPVQIRSSSASPQPRVSMAEASNSSKTPTLVKRVNKK